MTDPTANMARLLAAASAGPTIRLAFGTINTVDYPGQRVTVAVDDGGTLTCLFSLPRSTTDSLASGQRCLLAISPRQALLVSTF